jgi:hypothetical protein
MNKAEKKKSALGIVDMFSTPLARNTDPSTSHIAAAGVQRSGVIKEHQDLIEQTIRENPHSTAKDVGKITGVDGIWKRFNEVRIQGRIKKSGQNKDGETFVIGYDAEYIEERMKRKTKE